MTNFLSDSYLPEMMTYAKQAQSAYLWMDASSIDHVLTAVLDGFPSLCSDLARISVEETRMGIYEDKLIFLNHTLNDIRRQYLPVHLQQTVRLSRMNSQIQRQPAGIIAGIADNFQPAAEILFICMTAIRTGNPVILSFHPSAYGCSYAAASAIRDLAVSAGAPDNCIQWLEENTPDMLENLLRHQDIAAITASGQPASIRQYMYACQKPCAISYPSGSFCYIHQSADIQRAARQLILSRTFDNGLSSCSEQTVLIDHSIYSAFREILQGDGCYFASPEEITRLTAVLVDLSSDTVNPAVMGQTPQTVASMADITIPEDTRLIAMEMTPERSDHPLLIPFLCPAILLMSVEQNEQAIDKIRKLSTPETDFSTDTLLQDLPELPRSCSLVIHALDSKVVTDMSHALPNFNLIKNAPAAGQSLTGQYMNRYGSKMNAKAVQELLSLCHSHYEIPDIAHTFRLPAVLLFQKGALDSLHFTDDQTKITFLYNDSDTLTKDIPLAARHIQMKYPSLKYHYIHVPKDMQAGRSSDYLLPQLSEASPDCLIAIGDTQIMDTAKMLLTEYQTLSTSCSTRLILIPSIEGCHTVLLPFYGYYSQPDNTFYDKPAHTGDFTVIADNNLHFLSDENQAVPACMAAMADALDAFFSSQGDDLTDALALQSIALFLTWLPELSQGKFRPVVCLEHLQNACLLSGMAVAHTGIGLSKIMARRLYCDFRIPLATLQSILLPHILCYNGDPHPSKNSWNTPSSGYSISDKLLRLYNAVGYTSDPLAAPSNIVETLLEKIRNILHQSGIPLSIKSCGIREKDYMMRIDIMAQKTFEQLSTTCADTNPRYPLIKELTQLYKQIYE